MWLERQDPRYPAVYRLSRFAPVDVSLPCFANLAHCTVASVSTATGYPTLILIKSICRISAPVTETNVIRVPRHHANSHLQQQRESKHGIDSERTKAKAGARSE